MWGFNFFKENSSEHKYNPAPESKYGSDYSEKMNKAMIATEDALNSCISLQKQWIYTIQQGKKYFQNLCFRVGQNVYSILVELNDGTYSYITREHYDAQLKYCEANNLIPCTFIVNKDNLKRVVKEGCGLIHTKTRKPIEFSTNTPSQQLSDWEMHNYATMYVARSIKSKGWKLSSITDVPDYKPHIWFYDDSGKKCYVFVAAHWGVKDEEYELTEDLSMLKDYTGYTCVVSIERLDGRNLPLYRGIDYNISTKGMKRIGVSIPKKEKNNHQILADGSIPELIEQYDCLLKDGFNAGGATIQEYIMNNNMRDGFEWLNTKYDPQLFHHICFSYKGNIFSVLINFFDGARTLVKKEVLHNQIKICKENNLIPCILTLDCRTFSPINKGSHLVHSETGQYVAIEAAPNKMPMSEWEINDMGVSVVVKDLKKEGYNVKSSTSVPGVEPQIWFIDEMGHESYVFVNTTSANNRSRLNYKIHPQQVLKLQKYNGYYAKVELESAETVVYDEEGKVIPPSKRFNAQDPHGIINRGDGMYVNYRGLDTIERYLANNTSK